jgi:KDO2-lipid IV(A) lauroyltransferase
MQWGEITEKHTRLLEQKIKAKPEFWLWSHNRWKRDIPEKLEELKQSQKEKFNAKFKKELSSVD